MAEVGLYRSEGLERGVLGCIDELEARTGMG